MKDLIICKNKKSKYVIVVSPIHDKNYRAAVILQSALYRVTGTSLPIVIDTEAAPSRYEIIVGQTNRENVTHPYDRQGILEIGFSISTHKDLLILSGGGFHGATFAVSAFVNKFLHYDPLHSWQSQNPPKMDEVSVPADYYFENSPRSWVQNIPERQSKGAHIYMVPTFLLPSGGTAFRGMGFIIRSANGKLMVIDGGQWSEGPVIVDLLKMLSGQEIPEVEGWFMTHPHADHIDAFLRIGETMADTVKIKGFYHNIPTKDFSYKWKEHERYERLYALRDNGFCPFYELKTGDTLEVDGVKMEVVYAFNPELEEYLNKRIEESIESINFPQGDAINNADTLYKFTADGHSALFIGDFMHFGEDFFYEKHPEVVPNLKADMIQVCHHGSNFLSPKFYHHVNARVALWSNTPDCWLFADNFLRQLRNRLYELRIVKNHLAGDGIYPIPFDMSDITEDDRKYYTAELDEINFSAGQPDGLLISRRYDYTLYLDEAQQITVDTKTFDADGEVSYDLNGAPASNVMTVAVGDVIGVTVRAKGEEKRYSYTVTPNPAKYEVLHLDMKAHKRGVLSDLSARGNNARYPNGTKFAKEDGRACFRPTSQNFLKIKGDDLKFGKGSFTLSVWVKPDELNKNSTMVYYGDDEHSCLPRYALRLTPITPKPQKPQIGAPSFWITNEKDRYNVGVFSSQVLEEGKWAQITVVHENINQKIYFNGKFAGERSLGVYLDVAGRNELLIGCGPNGKAPFLGAIGEVTLHNYALTDEQIATLYKESEQ